MSVVRMNCKTHGLYDSTSYRTGGQSDCPACSFDRAAATMHGKDPPKLIEVEGVTMGLTDRDKVARIAKIVHESAATAARAIGAGGQEAVSAMCQVLAAWIVESYPKHPQLDVAVNAVIENMRSDVEIMRKAKARKT